MTASNVVGATLQLKLKADSGYTSEESHRISADQWGDVLRVATGQLSSAERDHLKAMSVEHILIDVVPGEDGMGQEVYAKSVDDVVNLISKLAGEVDELEIQRDQLLAALKKLSFAAQITGGVAGRDDNLVAAIDDATSAIAAVKGGAATSSIEEFLLVWFDTTEEWAALLSNGHVLRGKWGAVGYAKNAALAYLGRGEAEFDVLDLGGDGPTYRYVKNDEYWQEGGAA